MSQRLSAIFAEHGVPGAQVIYADDNSEKEFNYGLANATTGDPVTSLTTFEAASLTKVVGTYVILQLVDEGVLDLDTPLSEYFEYPRIAGNPTAAKITARMALTHTSGMEGWAAAPSGPDLDTTPVSTIFEPGTQWSYSGEGFYYLQKTVESLTGTPFTELAKKRVFDRFGMTSSNLAYNPDFAAVSAVGHAADGTPKALRILTNPNIAFTLRTTATDYSNFLRGALLEGEGLTPATRDMMFTAAGSADHGGSDQESIDHIKWGLGIGLQNNELGNAIWHWGDNGSFKAFFIAYPETGKSVVIMTNSQNGLDTIDEIVHESSARTLSMPHDGSRKPSSRQIGFPSHLQGAQLGSAQPSAGLNQVVCRTSIASSSVV
ncbi:serine hydrolase [Rhodococcus sp. ARC_M6]|uniref:serine hydrolase domain-containing protein n=1 Tax=Rhodococcus sp. ARC_M6 TaxID=2928852 RepID=UPI001FB2E3E7|nr:serine hydrolase domain-containing protein [Rhodococcus sp. ARC_M6]MCJ0906923.1 beta-lactamase family protein [Rhodococcus sp. ARC_M6]